MQTAQRFISYLRVSTDSQGALGLGIDAQRSAVTKHVLSVNGQSFAEYVEVESGKRADRPELAKALQHAKITGAVLVIAKLDRLARNLLFIATLMESGVEFVAADMPLANRLTIHILAAVAEHERIMISERTKAALQAAKARGVKLGNPNGAAALRRWRKTQSSHAVATATQIKKADQHAANMLPVIADIRLSGAVTLQAIADQLNAREIRTARGGRWHPTTVSNLLARLPA